MRTLALVHKPELLEKLARVGKTKIVLKQLEEINPQPQRVRIEVASTAHEYNYDLETVAA